MSIKTDEIVRNFTETIRNTGKEKTHPYDSSATVTKVEGNRVWIHLPGGIDETPARRTINAQPGDTVQVRVSGGDAFLIGTGTNPPTDDRRAIVADKNASAAMEKAVDAGTAAYYAKLSADSAQESADKAAVAADSAQADATRANEAATAALADAATANQAANQAQDSANKSLTQLSIVEDVAGTLSWISEHGTYIATTDTTVVDGRVYFELVNGDYVPIGNPDPTANPTQNGWYILDVTDSQAEYVMAHLAVTSAGLWVLPSQLGEQFSSHPIVDSEGRFILDSDGNYLGDWRRDPQNTGCYKVLLSSSGMTVFNDKGVAVASYGAETVIGILSGKHVRIDSNSLDIMDGEDKLAIFSGQKARIGRAGQNRLDIESDGIGLLNALDNKTFSVKHSQTSETWKNVELASFADETEVAAGTFTISDDTTASCTPFVELVINSARFGFDVGITSIATAGSGVTTSLNSDAASEIVSLMEYQQITYQYATTTDTTVDSEKTYYELSGSDYIEAEPVGNEDPSSEGWYERSETSTTAYYPCSIYVSYLSNVSIEAQMDLVGTININGKGTIATIVNDAFDSSAGTDTFYRAINDVTNTNVAFGVGSGGYNHGVWSSSLNKWLIYGDQNGVVRIPNADIRFAGHSSKIGSQVNAYLKSNLTCTSGQFYSPCSIKLPAGVWIIEIGGRWNANSSGARTCNLSRTRGDPSINFKCSPASGGITQIRYMVVVSITSTTTYYLNAQHTAGTSVVMPKSGSGYGTFLRATRLF